MAFDDDPPQQLAAVRRNLQGCTQTQPPERNEYGVAIAGILNGTADADATADHLRDIQAELRRRAGLNGWFFGGTAEVVQHAVVYSTRRADGFVAGLARALMAEDASLSQPDADTIAAQLSAELSSPVVASSTRSAHAPVRLHLHGTPMWIAHTDEADIATDLAALPARLGLRPDSPLPADYVLLRLAVAEGHVPRFADSGGYPYWRPGGETLPIEQCPPALAGIPELVSDRLTVGNLTAPVQTYSRTV